MEHVGYCGHTTTQILRHKDHTGLPRGIRDVHERDCGAGLAFRLRSARDEEKTYDLVILLSGTNDLADKEKAEEEKAEAISSDVEETHELCYALGVPTLAVTIPPSKYSTSEKRGPPRRGSCADPTQADLNDRIRQLSDRNERITLVDLDLGLVMMSSDAVGEDGLHLTAEGYSTLARAVCNAMRCE